MALRYAAPFLYLGMMKRFLPLAVLLLALLQSGCRPNAGLKSGETTIVLQPLNGYDPVTLGFLQKDLQQFYQKRVLILPSKDMPPEFIDQSKGKRYAAHKVIRWLTTGKADSVIAVAGLTSEDIFTTKKDANGEVKKPESKYAVWGIFGLGYCPGDACVISDHRLKTADTEQFRRRLRTVVIHEIGHNLGLPHCSNKGCIMSDAHEKLSTVDSRSVAYCTACSEKAGM